MAWVPKVPPVPWWSMAQLAVLSILSLSQVPSLLFYLGLGGVPSGDFVPNGSWWDLNLWTWNPQSSTLTTRPHSHPPRTHIEYQYYIAIRMVHKNGYPFQNIFQNLIRNCFSHFNDGPEVHHHQMVSIPVHVNQQHFASFTTINILLKPPAASLKKFSNTLSTVEMSLWQWRFDQISIYPSLGWEGVNVTD